MKDISGPTVIACGIFRDELKRLMSQGTLKANLKFLNPGLHNDPPRLERALRGLLKKEANRNAENIILLYGDICLGFHNEMVMLAKEFGVRKVDALNCIDCYLGGRGRLLETDPNHEYFFLNPSWMALEFGKRDLNTPSSESRGAFNMLKGLYLLDTLKNLDQYGSQIEKIRRFTGLAVVGRKNIGVEGLEQVLARAMKKLPISAQG